jgi:two-component system response regulator NreC
MTTRALIADDHGMMREGLRLILGHAPEVEVIGEASNGREAVEMVARLHPHIVVMDIGMKDLNGIDATRRIKADHPDVAVIGLSIQTDKRFVLAMLEAGAAGYVTKDGAGDELLRAVEAVRAGRRYLCPLAADAIAKGYQQEHHLGPPPEPAHLGDREREVLQLMAEGNSSKEIATRLHISPATAETHRRNIMRKLGLHSVAALTKYAVREGLTALDE